MVCGVRCPVQLRLEYMYLMLGCTMGNIYEVKLGRVPFDRVLADPFDRVLADLRIPIPGTVSHKQGTSGTAFIDRLVPTEFMLFCSL